jgi:hypothetical protein
MYGLGWDLFDLYGKKVVCHSGGLDGMISQTALVPEEKLGLVILTNSSNYLPTALMYKILDTFLSSEEKDWSGIYLNYKKLGDNYDKEQNELIEKNRNKETKPSLPLEKYTGTYSGDLYGDATISILNGKLKLQMTPAPDFYSELLHSQYNTFNIRFEKFPSLPVGTVNFILNEKGDVVEFKIDVPNPDFDFTELEFKKIK